MMEQKEKQVKKKLRAAASALGRGDYVSAYRHILTALYLLEELLMTSQLQDIKK